MLYSKVQYSLDSPSTTSRTLDHLVPFTVLAPDKNDLCLCSIGNHKQIKLGFAVVSGVTLRFPRKSRHLDSCECTKSSSNSLLLSESFENPTNL